MDSRRQIYELSEDDLWRLAGQDTYPDAQRHYDRFRKIMADGGVPRCFYSRFDRFAVLDETKPDQMIIVMSMEQHSKPFRI